MSNFCPLRLFSHIVNSKDALYLPNGWRYQVSKSQRKKIAIRKAESGQKISFSTWILKCIAQAISEHKEVHAIKKGSNKAIIYNDTDISILVEKKVNGTLVPLPLVIRKVDSKDVSEIYNEIEKAKEQTIEEGKNDVIEQTG